MIGDPGWPRQCRAAGGSRERVLLSRSTGDSKKTRKTKKPLRAMCTMIAAMRGWKFPIWDRRIQAGSKRRVCHALGISLSMFTMVHVIISLIAIVAGIIVMFGLLGSNPMPGLTAIFLLFTILTNATGFLFPFEKLQPSYIIAAISLVLLAIACIALYGMKLAGAWR